MPEAADSVAVREVAKEEIREVDSKRRVASRLTATASSRLRSRRRSRPTLRRSGCRNSRSSTCPKTSVAAAHCKVSLVRLERAIAELLETDKPIPESMQYLAGLQRIDFVFVFPETKDLVIAGPAEAFAPDATGRVVSVGSVGSGRPVLRLDDLLVAAPHGGTDFASRLLD